MITFLGATKHLYNWLCPSVGRSVTHSFDDPHLIGLLGLVLSQFTFSLCYSFGLMVLTTACDYKELALFLLVAEIFVTFFTQTLKAYIT